MAEAIPDEPGVSESTYFLIRRLHSLCGVVPVGVFLCFHLTINSTVLFGGSKFQSAVDAIHLLDKVGLLYVAEVVGIFIPLAFHAILGIQIWLSGQQNMLSYSYGGNVRYTFQRWTGLVVLAFIILHLWQMHWLGKPFQGGRFDPHDAPYTAAAAIQNAWWYAPAYAIGLLCAVFHFCNGIWTFLITWGVTIGRRAQRNTGYACFALALLLAAAGLSSLAKLRVTPPADFQAEPRGISHVADITGP